MDAVTMPNLRVALLCVLAAAACAFPTGDSWEVSMEVTAESAAPSPPGRLITFDVVNRSNETRWVPSCDGAVSVAVERLEGQWVDHAAAACRLNMTTTPIQIEPGAAVSSQRLISDQGIFRLRTGHAKSAQGAMTWNVYSRAIEIPQ
jgi:hypothetical protein